MLPHLTTISRRLVHAGGMGLGALGWTADYPLVGPVYAQVGISDRCNYKCVMCGYHPRKGMDPIGQFAGRPPGRMSAPVFRRLADELKALGTWQLDFVGRGEPLLHPGVVEMVAYAKRRGFAVTLTTNGSLLTSAMSRALLATGLDRLRVSLNAASAGTYTAIHVNQTARGFSRVLANVRRLADLRCSTGAATHLAASFVIGAANYHELAGMIDLSCSSGLDAAHFQYGVRMEGADELRLTEAAYRTLVDELVPATIDRARARDLATDLAALRASPPGYRFVGGPDLCATVPCYVGFFFAIVLGNGRVVPCCQTQKAVGDLGERPFTEIWRGESYRRFRRAARRLPQPDSALATCECDSCFFRPHNVTIHNLLNPASRIAASPGEEGMRLRDLLRLSRLEGG